MTTIEEHSARGLSITDTVATEDYTVGCLSVPNRYGDLRVMWDSRNKDEVAAARKQFEELRGKGYLAFKAEGKDGHRGEQIDEFDKRAERIILIHPPQGG